VVGALALVTVPPWKLVIICAWPTVGMTDETEKRVGGCGRGRSREGREGGESLERREGGEGKVKF
jgi:hypothetical protein